MGGPTAGGKTRYAIRLAKQFQTDIISSDSRQFYREMSIGTAKPTKEELAEARHHFIGHISIADHYSVGDFERDAMKVLHQLFQEKDIVVVAGGSGLYIKALCEGLDDFPEVSPDLKSELNTWYLENGLAALQATVREVDPEYYGQVDIYNPHRLLRALAVYRASGWPFSSFRKN